MLLVLLVLLLAVVLSVGSLLVEAYPFGKKLCSTY